MQYRTLHNDTESTMQSNAVHGCALQQHPSANHVSLVNTVQYRTAHYSTTHCDIAQYIAVQYRRRQRATMVPADRPFLALGVVGFV